MRWLQNLSFSSNPSTSGTSSSSSYSSASLKHSLPSSASSSSSDACSSRHTNHRSFLRGGALALRFGGRSKLARQRKLCYLSEQDVSTTQTSLSSITVNSSSDSSEPVQLTRSPSCSSKFSTSVPLPLPLPLPVQCGDGDWRFPSPNDKQKEKEKEKIDGGRNDKQKEKDKIDGGGTGTGTGEEICSSIRPIESIFVGKERKKMVEHLEIKSPRVHPDVCLDNNVANFGINIPCRSASASPFSSPVISPQRLTSADLLRYYQMIAKGNQVWSAPEMATVDMTGLPPPAFFDFTALSTDSSPLHSPPSRSPSSLNPRSPNGPSSLSPLNGKLSIETTPSNANIEVHPLPLPPGAAKPSPSAPIPQVIAKAESMPLKSQWQKGKLIGRGTFGSVYVASNRETGALCAMKEVDIFPDDPKSAESIKQLEQEIKVLSQLKHPNIVQYYGSEIVEDHFYIYLEYIHPGSINKYVREHCGAITENVVRSFTRHILSGLAYLHRMKTIHRDIKGANLLVDASGVVKLADFGMSKLLTGQAAELSLRGSPNWMAPELMQAVLQKDSNSDLALAVDIWSLGCTIIEMFTGKPPWSDFEGAAAMFKVLKDSPPVPGTLSPEGKDFLSCCFKRNPAERSSAIMLLEHRWLKNLQQLEASSPTPSINGIKLMDISYCSNTPEVKFDQTSIIPGSQCAKGKVPSDCIMRHSFSSARMPNDSLMKLPT